MHRYNNMDHSMLTGILAAENLVGADHNIWAVNDADEYLEGTVPSRTGSLFNNFNSLSKKLSVSAAIAIVLLIWHFW
jgi:hypothetical protein